MLADEIEWADQKRTRAPTRMLRGEVKLNPLSRKFGFGAVALGATAIGALAVGRLAVGTFALKRGRVGHLTVDNLAVRRLHIGELIVDSGLPR